MSLSPLSLPKSKSRNVVVQDLENELLIYDLGLNKAYCLNRTSAIVFDACRENGTFAELKSKYQFSDDLIFLALDELKRAGLLEENADYVSSFAGISRREAVKRVGLRSMIALPVIYSLIAPAAVHAQSNNLFTCANPGAATSQFCASSAAGCNSQSKTLCATCGASASPSGLCSANPVNTITCTCGGAACSNPGASTASFCASSPAGCSAAGTLCLNCSATASASGLCSANLVNTITCTCV